MKKRAKAPSSKRFIAVIVIAIAIIGIIIYINRGPSAPSYTSSQYGFSFDYPQGYSLNELNTTTTPLVHVITLVPTTNTPPPKDSEGPPTIEIAVYNAPSTGTLAEWLANNSSTNFSLPNSVFATTTLTDGTPAVAYHWSGLYEGESVALEHNSKVIIFSGMYVNPTDRIKTDFESILASLQLT